MATLNEGTKRKKPPTFQHLPVERAKKLKRSWVDVQKIKSKWKAQKRKEGLVTPRRQLDQIQREEPLQEGGPKRDAETDQEMSVASDSSSESEEVDGDGEDYVEEHPVTSKSKSTPPARRNHKKAPRGEVVEDQEQKPSLRELSRQAYSRSSLHNHRSDHLHRHGLGGESSRARGRGRGALRNRGGQPDMRLRMNAMLEKIKRDFT